MTRIILAAALAAVLPAQAMAQGPGPCHPGTELQEHLMKKYKEAPVSLGLQSNGHLLQIFTTESGDTWTIVSTAPGGMSCIVAVGKSWQTLPSISTDPLA